MQSKLKEKSAPINAKRETFLIKRSLNSKSNGQKLKLLIEIIKWGGVDIQTKYDNTKINMI